MKIKLGDIVYIYIYGVVKHFGVVIAEGSFLSDPIIRTVHAGKTQPLNQAFSDFSEGKKVFVAQHSSNLSGYQIVQRVLSTTDFSYNLITNNCEHFYRQACGLMNVSIQVIIGGVVATLALTSITKRPFAKMLRA